MFPMFKTRRQIDNRLQEIASSRESKSIHPIYPVKGKGSREVKILVKRFNRLVDKGGK